VQGQLVISWVEGSALVLTAQQEECQVTASGEGDLWHGLQIHQAPALLPEVPFLATITWHVESTIGLNSAPFALTPLRPCPLTHAQVICNSCSLFCHRPSALPTLFKAISRCTSHSPLTPCPPPKTHTLQVSLAIRLAVGVTEAQAAADVDHLLAAWLAQPRNIRSAIAISGVPDPIGPDAIIKWLLTPEIWVSPVSKSERVTTGLLLLLLLLLV